jgi:hypothetical protein
MAFHDAERIDVGDLMASQGIDLDQSRDRGLLFAGG